MNSEHSKFKRTRTPEAKKPLPTPEEPVSFVGDTSDDDITDLVASAKQYVKGIFVPTGSESSLLEVNAWVPMVAPIQEVIQAQGLPCGLITMAMGKEDCGKTTFATEALISAQKNGGIAILLDTENKYNLKRAAGMGLDVKRLIIIPALTIEEAFDKFVTMINHIKSKSEYHHKKTGEIVNQTEFDKVASAKKKDYKAVQKYKEKRICCVWDSLGATPSEAEMDKDTKDFSMTAAKIIKGKMRKLVRYIRDTNVAFIIINQVYTNMNSFGKKTTSYGGSGPLYHSALILEFTKIGRCRRPGGKGGEDFDGIRTQIEAVKNHLGQPFKKVEVEIDWRGFVVGRDVEAAPPEIKAELDEKDREGSDSAGIPEGKKKRATAKAEA